MTRAGIAALYLCACDPAATRAPLASCVDDLRGVYVAAAGQRWMVLDHRATLEAYPLFADVDAAAVPGLEVAPRALDLRRDAGALAGTLTRRYLSGTDRCDARVPVHVTACTGDTLELVLADPLPPLGFAPCTWGQPAPSRRERWHRE